MKLKPGQVSVVGALQFDKGVEVWLELRPSPTGSAFTSHIILRKDGREAVTLRTSAFESDVRPKGECFWPTTKQWTDTQPRSSDRFGEYVLATLTEQNALSLTLTLVGSGHMNAELTLGRSAGQGRLLVDHVKTCGCFVDPAAVRVTESAAAK